VNFCVEQRQRYAKLPGVLGTALRHKRPVRQDTVCHRLQVKIEGMKKLFLLVWVALAIGAWGQDAKVMMLSDLHFDPLHDPAKAERLAAAPVEGWDAILKAPESAGSEVSFASLQVECHARGVDSDYGLLTNALQAAAEQGKGAAFVTVTGDLLVHGFDCRYKHLFKDTVGYAAFAEKTAVYVMSHVEAAFPGVPVYIAGGNNDSACGDYKLNDEDAYLAATNKVVMNGLRGRATKEESVEYGLDGSFGVMVPGLKKTRLLVLDDIYLSGGYSACGGREDATAGARELAWLDKELAEVKTRGEQAWVIGHIPPGVNVYSTLAKAKKDVCGEGGVKMFLADDGLAEVLAKHADVVRLGVFAHTHSDEVRVLGGKVPVKMVASISPVNGNRPTFTVAAVAKATAVLQDFTVFEASNATWEGTTWAKEYGFRETYGVKDFSGGSIAGLVGRLQADKGGAEAASRAYENYFTPGMIPLLGFVWPKYACALNNTTEETYKACACAVK
jgi:sphingomyelin phosphodiesterase acid-like 3